MVIVLINHDHRSLTPYSFSIDDLGARMENSAAPTPGSARRVLQDLQTWIASRGEIYSCRRTPPASRLPWGYAEERCCTPPLSPPRAWLVSSRPKRHQRRGNAYTDHADLEPFR